MDEKRKKFYSAMSEAIEEDKSGEYASIINKKRLEGTGVDEKGNLSKGLLDDLRDFKQDELLNLEEAIKNARLPTEDIFGIRRRFCTVCE